MSAIETADALMILYAAFPNTEWSTTTQAVYAKHLADIPVEELKTVIAQAIGTCRFPPTVAEIRDTWHGLSHVGRLTYGEAWELVQKEIRRVGSYSKPQFSDETTARVVAAMGWKELCMSEDQGRDRAQFRDMYNALVGRDDTVEKLLPQARQLAERKQGLIPMSNVLVALTDKRNGSR